MVYRSFSAEYIERVRGCHETAAYQKAMRKRKVWVEPLFGEAKQWHGLRHFRLRGLNKVNMEGLLVAAGLVDMAPVVLWLPHLLPISLSQPPSRHGFMRMQIMHRPPLSPKHPAGGDSCNGLADSGYL